MKFTAQEIADILNGKIEGNAHVTVSHLSRIEDGKPGTLTFLANPKYAQYIYDTNASIVLINDDFVLEKETKATLIRVPNAYMALAILLDIYNKSNEKTGIDPKSHIASSAQIDKNGIYVGAFAYIGENSTVGKNTKIYPQVYIGDKVEIGEDTILYPGVKVYSGCKIGNRCIIHAGAVIGADGFGFTQEGNTYKKIPQVGNVIIEDDVEIGANTTIDRAVIDSTIIRSGVKLDNLIQIAHNVEVGKNTAMAAQVGVAGSTKIGRNCMFGGQVGLGGHIKIGDKVNIGAQSGLISNVEDGKKLIGSPAIEVNNFFRSSYVFSKLPEMYRQLNKLQQDFESLQKQINNDND
ncbi:MAG: UDP-3-O-(3-hydroxymyristoyl)glucosamine N-acyltransferase [Dysgonamonadaceae bacterium]|jgi:UDP-3-O-[3-hydroxymyristoyl] glucosamine N-acyltransferase|nr:UDP-3-O-(3-hydroxymyristoyl)glucosamine N-acyltransferase [Dysgonamonadaceae bacterium]